ncbi:MAG: hypothetical protein R2932_37630 [Caldilineaceae bacterium]
MQQEVHRRPVAGMALVYVANRLYGLLLYLYPRRFRHEYGEPMAQLFRDAMRQQLRRGGMAALLSLWILTLFDLVRSVFVEQMAELFHVSVDWGGTTMTYLEKIREFAREPEQLELAYQAAVKAGERGAFTEAIQLAHTEDRGNLLYSAWYYRLLHAAGRVIAWSWAIPLAILNGLLLWWLSDEQGYTLQIVNPFSGVQGHSSTPLVLVVGMGIAAIIIITFLAGAGDRHWRRLVLIALGLMGVTAYVIYFFPQTGTSLYQEQYLALMPLNLALLAWAGIGIYALIGHWDPGNRFAFLVKSLEFLIVGGSLASSCCSLPA